jgi:dTDP-4-amino-4,6-dideoxygalactose transaminase
MASAVAMKVLGVVMTSSPAPIPIHLQPAYADARWKRGDFPHSEKAANEVLSLPMYPELNRLQQDEVIAAVLETAKQLVPTR